MARKTGFTTSILHSIATRRSSTAPLHKPLHLSVAYGYTRCARTGGGVPGQGAPATPTAARAIRPPRRSKRRSTAMEDGIATVCFGTGMAAIGAIAAGAAARGRPHRRQLVPVRQHQQPVQHARDARHRRDFRRCDRRRNVEARDDAEHTRMVFVETIANPRTQVADLARIGELCAARGLLYVVDNTMTSPCLFRPKSVGRQPDRQRADQVHRRPRQRAGRQRDRHRPLRLDALSEHLRQLQGRRSRRRGASRRSARRACATGAARWPPSRRITSRSAPKRWRCGWTGNARTRWRWRELSRSASEGARGLLSGAALPSAARRLRRRCSARFGALLSFELDPGIDCFDFLNRLRSVVLSSNLGDNRTLAIPVAQTIFWEMGAERRATMGIADSLVRVSVGIEDQRRPDRRFRAGACRLNSGRGAGSRALGDPR